MHVGIVAGWTKSTLPAALPTELLSSSCLPTALLGAERTLAPSWPYVLQWKVSNVDTRHLVFSLR